MSNEDVEESAGSSRTPPAGRQQGRLRWRRFAVMMVTSAAAGAALIVATAQGALAAQFSISGVPFTITADSLSGNGFEQFATLDTMIPNSPNAGSTGGQEVLIVSALKSADLVNLCQSINLGGSYLKLKAGTVKGHPVHATTMVVDSSDLSAMGSSGGNENGASFNNINIGQDASTLTQVPGVTGFPGILGQQADTVTITGLRQTNYATTAATFTLPDLSMSFTSSGC